jgi:WhiB family redox-sensing transcriptional regulator
VFDAPTGAPGDWYEDPVLRGVPGLEPLDDDGALAWQSDALCAQTDPEAFFPRRAARPATPSTSAPAARSVTSALQYALEHDERFGIWGGLSERERRRLRRRAV